MRRVSCCPSNHLCGSDNGARLCSLLAELRYRPVRIYRPTKSTMQSAKGKTRRWIVDWDVLQGSGRWENPLMGWGSSADYMQGTTMAFRTREDAVHFVRPLYSLLIRLCVHPALTFIRHFQVRG